MTSVRTRFGALIIGTCFTLAACAPSVAEPSLSARSSAPPSAAGIPPSTAPGSLTTSGSPAESLPTPIIPGRVDPEATLPIAWKAVGPVAGTYCSQPAMDARGRIWVVAQGQHRFWVFDQAGKFVEAWGTRGKGKGQLDFTRGSDSFGGIAFAADGSFFTSEAGNHRVQHFDKERQFLSTWGSFGQGDDQFISPNAIRTDAAGNVYVQDDDLMLVKVFKADGTFIRSIAENSNPFMHVTKDGHVYAVIDTTMLTEFGPDGHVIRRIDLTGLVAFAIGMSIDDAGNLWIASEIDEGDRSGPDRLLELSPEGKLLHDWPGVAADAFVLASTAHRLYSCFFHTPYLAAYDLPG